jgi:hypothetical protein
MDVYLSEMLWMKIFPKFWGWKIVLNFRGENLPKILWIKICL